MSREKTHLQRGDEATRIDNGRRVLILDVRPTGYRVEYDCEDLESGRITKIDGRNLRPVNA